MSVSKAKTLTESPPFGVKMDTIFRIPGTEFPTGDDVRAMIDFTLNERYSVQLSTIQNSLTLVTDRRAVMAKMAGSSVSQAECPLDENWLRCLMHTFHNLFKDAMDNC